MSRVAVFGGTSEGRILAERLSACGVEVCAFVATAYGEALIEPCAGLAVRQGRLNREEMSDAFKKGGFDAVVDATHPYAAEVTENLVAAACDAGVFYLRLTRGQTGCEGVTEVESVGAAAELLNQTGGKVLLTTGSKELEAFTAVKDFQNRLYARVLPDAETVKKCVDMGFRGRNLICMQGPFTHDMNVATIRMLGVGTVVTKASGDAGGFPEKLSAARECGARLIVIRRPGPAGAVDGMSVKTALDILASRLKLRNQTSPAACPRFPFFVSLKGRKALIIGGGNIAARRARKLLQFGAEVTVIAPEISHELRELLDGIIWNQERYCGIGEDYVLVIAATNDRDVNRQIGADAKAAGIPVSVADNRDESSFWFPAIARGGGIVAGIISEDANHGAVKKAAEEIRKSLGEDLWAK